MKRLILALALYCACVSLAQAQIYNPPQMPAWVNTNPATVRTNLGLGANDSVTFAGITNTGDSILGDAAGDSVTVNAGSFTAPNATNTSGGSVANVGALDGRYAARNYKIYKVGNTTRSNIDIPTADPELAFSNVKAGVYKATLFFFTYGHTNTGGFNWKIGGTATMSPLSRSINIPLIGSLVVGTLSDPFLGEAVAAWNNSQRASMVIFSLQITSPGSVEFQWSQSVAQTNEIYVFKGSFFTLDPL